MKQKDALEILKLGHNVLLTGFAGSGKSYLLEEFASWARGNKKNVVMTATTGIAATNINGKTIHNYSNLGVRERLDLANKEKVISLANNMREPYKKSIINTDILVIDEISMLHDYQLNAVDKILRVVRNNDRHFGGLQVILSGDFFQLPPIDRNNGQTNFITQSDSYINGDFKVCYLEEYWRQNENDPLGSVLNAIRCNKLKDEHYTLLKQRAGAILSKQNTTKLCCTNKEADVENNQQLDLIITDSKSYKWIETGDAKELNELKKDCRNKVAEKLELKIGAQVIFVKNSLRLGYFNGTTGKVVDFDNNGYPTIELNNGKTLYGIQEDDFYREDEQGNRLATIKQIPLKLAWAITIHKSQGMTLDKSTVVLTNAFTAGQGYVALSRVRSINDITLIGLDNRMALAVSQEALNIENELQEKSKQSLKYLTIKKSSISSNPGIIVESPSNIDRFKIYRNEYDQKRIIIEEFNKGNLPRDRDLTIPTIIALKQLGGKGKNSEIFDKICINEKFTSSQLSILKTGNANKPELENRADWARTILSGAKIIDRISTGVWKLVNLNIDPNLLTKEEIFETYKKSIQK